MSKLIKINLAVVLIMFIGTALDVSPVAADSCPALGNIHYYNFGETHGYTTYGGHTKSTEQNYFAPDWASWGFVDQTLWVTSGVQTSSYWAEIGFGHGWEGQNIKYFYYARANPSLPYAEFKLNKTPGGAGTWHTYEIIISSNGVFTSKIDGTTYYTTAGFDNYSQKIQFGGEITSGSATMPDAPANELYYKNSAGTWSQWSSATTKTVCYSDDPYQWAWSAFPNSGHFWR